MQNTAARWTLFTAVGLSVGIAAGVLIGIPLNQILNAMLVTALVVLIAGGILGGFQAAALRRLLAKPSWWIAATTVGMAAGLAVGVVLVEETGRLVTGTSPRVAFLSASMRALSFVVIGLTAGTAIGVAQWLVLRVKNWIAVCGAALAVSFCLSSLLVDASGIQFASGPGRFGFLVLSGLMFGALTSWPLRRTA